MTNTACVQEPLEIGTGQSHLIEGEEKVVSVLSFPTLRRRREKDGWFAPHLAGALCWPA